MTYCSVFKATISTMWFKVHLVDFNQYSLKNFKKQFEFNSYFWTKNVIFFKGKTDMRTTLNGAHLSENITKNFDKQTKK